MLKRAFFILVKYIFLVFFKEMKTFLRYLAILLQSIKKSKTLVYENPFHSTFKNKNLYLKP